MVARLEEVAIQGVSYARPGKEPDLVESGLVSSCGRDGGPLVSARSASPRAEGTGAVMTAVAVFHAVDLAIGPTAGTRTSGLRIRVS